MGCPRFCPLIVKPDSLDHHPHLGIFLWPLLCSLSAGGYALPDFPCSCVLSNSSRQTCCTFRIFFANIFVFHQFFFPRSIFFFLLQLPRASCFPPLFLVFTRRQKLAANACMWSGLVWSGLVDGAVLFVTFPLLACFCCCRKG